jgi:chromosome segregation ATPase
MPVDLQESLNGAAAFDNNRDGADVPLDEFLTTQDEFSAFFGEVFDQLQALSLELFARHKCLEVSTQQKSQSDDMLVGYREEMLCLIEELQQLRGHLQADRQLTQESWTAVSRATEDWRASYQRFIDDHADLREIREGCRQIAGEFTGIKEEVQRERKEMHKLCANVESQLSQLTEACAALTAAQPQQNNEQFAEILSITKQQQAEWLQQRTALEAELEDTRRRASEQAQALGEQKSLASRQQAELSGELKRMRSLLETLGSQVRGEPAGTLHPESADEVAKPAGHPLGDESSVLGSVLAQFEMLQRDINARRAGRHHGNSSSGESRKSNVE